VESAVLPPAAAHPKRSSGAREASLSGNTQPKLAILAVPPAAAALRMPQVPPMLSANGTGTLWVTSITESMTPPAPQ
jgi:hypothetical protein